MDWFASPLTYDRIRRNSCPAFVAPPKALLMSMGGGSCKWWGEGSPLVGIFRDSVAELGAGGETAGVP